MNNAKSTKTKLNFRSNQLVFVVFFLFLQCKSDSNTWKTKTKLLNHLLKIQKTNENLKTITIILKLNIQRWSQKIPGSQ